MGVLEWKGTPGKICVVQRILWGRADVLASGFKQNWAPSSCVSLDHLFLILVSLLATWVPGNPAENREKLENSKDMNSNSYFEAGYCSGPLGLILNIANTGFNKQELGLLRDSWVLQKVSGSPIWLLTCRRGP